MKFLLATIFIRNKNFNLAQKHNREILNLPLVSSGHLSPLKLNVSVCAAKFLT